MPNKQGHVTLPYIRQTKNDNTAERHKTFLSNYLILERVFVKNSPHVNEFGVPNVDLDQQCIMEHALSSFSK